MTNHIHPDFRKVAMIWLLVAVALAAVLFSCSPSKKAHEYFAGHPKEFASDCTDAYPIVPIIDSSGYKESLGKIDDLQEQLEADRFKDDQDRQYYEAEVTRLKNIAPPDCDSLSWGYDVLISKEKRRNDTLEKRTRQLTDAAKNVKPVKETQESTAKVEACEQDVARLTSALTNALVINGDLTEEVHDLKATAKKRWWLIVALIAVIAAIILRKPILNIAKSIFMKTLIPFLTIILLSVLASCGHFHDDPKVSVWADGLWIVPTLIFGGSFFFAWKAYKTHNSGSRLIDSGAITNKEGGKVPYKAVSWTRFAVGLLIAGIIVVWFMNSNCNR